MKMQDSSARDFIRQAKLVVVKVGTSVLTDARGILDEARVDGLCRQMASLRDRRIQVTLVTSAAIAAGIGRLGLSGRPSSLPQLQAAAAAGQSLLMQTYERMLEKYGYKAGQILLTREDFEDRRRYVNARNALLALMDFGAIPIINENDTVSVDEITFGDNDILSALVTNLLGADVLVILTSVDGLHRAGAGGSRELVEVVERVTDEVRALASGEKSILGMGGMKTKLEAAHIATNAGKVVVIANGRQKDTLLRAMAGQKVGTLFLPGKRPLGGKKLWLGHAIRPKGCIVVDEGARRVIENAGKSLLPSGVRDVSGDFEAGDLVSITDPSGREFARGLASYAAGEIHKIKGLQTGRIAEVLGKSSHEEVVHRNNMVLLDPEAAA